VRFFFFLFTWGVRTSLRAIRGEILKKIEDFQKQELDCKTSELQGQIEDAHFSLRNDVAPWRIVHPVPPLEQRKLSGQKNDGLC
jgi:hypothetical protein